MPAIRLIAAAIVRAGDRILVWHDHDPVTGAVVAVPLAGGVEFGETGEQAIRRELLEEIGAEAASVSYLGTLEDIFEWAGAPRHEVFLVYEVELADRSLYEREQLDVVEDDGARYLAHWRPLSDFGAELRLVPGGLLDLIR
ncbi:MAG TPA: NUDIX domain-containing protein [Gaiellaceae bacterium]|jgi:ADP-ribose pyrophosphatase YjhB (NUDIX family)|nr:NUDIX domain-containing protein [Gaiellaceae bacterium]